MTDFVGLSQSARLGAGELDHLGPLLGFFGDELAEVGGRSGKCENGSTSSAARRVGKIARRSGAALTRRARDFAHASNHVVAKSARVGKGA